MSSTILRTIGFKVRTLIRGIAKTNQERWSALCPFSEITPSQFSQAVARYSIYITPREVSEIWRLAGIEDPVMSFNDFVSFLWSSTGPLTPSQTLYRLSTVQKSQLFLQFVSLDPQQIGLIDFSSFTAAFRAIVPSASDGEISELFELSDSDHCGKVNYFKLLSIISPAAAQNDQNGSGQTERSPGHGGRGTVDPLIFPSAASSQRYFQEISASNQVKPAEVSQDEHEAAAQLSALAKEKGSPSQCFSELQMNGVISAQSLQASLSAADKEKMNTKAVYSFLAKHGDSISKSEFLRLLGEGFSSRPVVADLQRLRRQVEEDVVINVLAERCKGKDWKPQMSKSKSPESCSNNLRSIEVYIDASDLANLFHDVGTEGIVSEIEKIVEKPKQ